MNNVILVGRLVKDPEIKYVGEKNSAVSNLILAVPRDYKSSTGEKEADFINIEFWGRIAETCYNHLGKGRKIAVEGKMRVDRYLDANGNTKYFTKVKGDSFTFLDSSKDKSLAESEAYYDATSIFEQDKDGIEASELPF